MHKTNFLSALSFVLFIVSKQSSQYQIPNITCYEGSSSEVDVIPNINSFVKKQCNNTLTSQKCGVITYKATYMGVTTSLEKRSCIPSNQCDNFNCNLVHERLNHFSISLCKARCCDTSLCNSPRKLFSSPLLVIDNTNKSILDLQVCMNNPCKNGGKCVPLANSLDKTRYWCKCPRAFVGNHCEERSYLRCYTGMKSTQLGRSTHSLIQTQCRRGSVCIYAFLTTVIEDKEVYLEIARCGDRSECLEVSCDQRNAFLAGYAVKSCSARCCYSDFCNNIQGLATKIPYFTTTTTTTPVPKYVSLDQLNTWVRVLLTRKHCPRRDETQLLLTGRVCPPFCKSNHECYPMKQCNCDAACGQSCSPWDSPCFPDFRRLRPIPGRKIKCNNANYVGSKCQVTCDQGYEHTSPVIFHCQSDRFWDSRKYPGCKAVKSFDCPDRKNSSRDCSKPCQSHGNCREDQKCLCDGLCGMSCVTPGATCRNQFLRFRSRSRVVKCTNGALVGSMCEASCKEGFALFGLQRKFCQANGLWDPVKLGKCYPIGQKFSVSLRSPRML